MKILQYSTVGEHKGLSRIYLDGSRLLHSFKPGEFYKPEELADGRVVLKKSDSGLKVSKRKRKDNVLPVIDCRNDVFSVRFGIGKKVRIVFKRGLIVIERHHLEEKKRIREARLLKKLRGDIPLSIASAFSGAGVLDAALVEGLRKSNVQCNIDLIIEREGRFIDLAMMNQEANHSDETVVINADVEDIDLDAVSMQVDVFTAGIPCVSASRAGRTKGGLKFAEEHNEAGAMFYYYLRLVSLLQPSVLLIENVADFASTASFAVITSVLKRAGYNLSFESLNGCDFGALENRNRLCLIGVSNGFGELDVSSIRSLFTKPETVSEALEEIPSESPRWKTYSYLDQKRERDAKEGKGFSRDILSGSESHCKVLRAGYAKGGSCESFVAHPTNKDLSRLLTPVEHCRMKRIPYNLVIGESDSVQHQALGQSVIYTLFVSVAFWLGNWMKELSAERFRVAA